jgi:hypothetical protein
MALAHEAYVIECVELSNNSKLKLDFSDGQKKALQDIGVSDDDVSSETISSLPGTYGVIARAQSGEVIGGLRVHTRENGCLLPLESKDSPLSLPARARLIQESRLCEVSGLWVAPHAAGRFLSRRIVAHAVALGYRLGSDAIVGLSHARAFRFITEPLDFEKDEIVPPMAYPDDRFLSFVVWHKAGLASILKHIEPVTQVELSQQGLHPSETTVE